MTGEYVATVTTSPTPIVATLNTGIPRVAKNAVGVRFYQEDMSFSTVGVKASWPSSSPYGIIVTRAYIVYTARVGATLSGTCEASIYTDTDSIASYATNAPNTQCVSGYAAELDIPSAGTGNSKVYPVILDGETLYFEVQSRPSGITTLTASIYVLGFKI